MRTALVLLEEVLGDVESTQPPPSPAFDALTTTDGRGRMAAQMNALTQGMRVFWTKLWLS
jgi:hypothetical protein